MTSFQDLKLLFNLLRYKVQGHRFPAHVIISVTNRCNLNCSYCFAGYNAKESDEITMERMIPLLDELRDKGTRLINLTGGEPLIRKDIKTIIDYIVLEKGIKCSLSTNGLFLEEKIEALENISSINISLDGNEEQHTRNRGHQNYKKVIKAIEIALSNNIPISTCTVLNKTNIDCVDDIVELSKEKGFLSIFHIPYGRLNIEENQEFNPMSQEETRKVLQKIIDYKNSGYPIYYSKKTHTYVRDWPYNNPSRILQMGDRIYEKEFKILPCIAGDLYCFIDANGRVYPCTVLSGQVQALNFLEIGFQVAWDFLPQIRCKACSFFFQNELNLLLSMDIAAWLNFIKTTKILG